MTFATNASLEDISQTLTGILALTPLLFVTGYLLNRATGVLVPRNAAVMDTAGASLALSLSVLPIFLHLMGRISMAGTTLVFWASAAGFVIILWNKRGRFLRAIREPEVRWCVLGALLWVAVSVVLQIDIQWHNHVYPPGIVVDQALRIGTVGAVNRATVLPPADPFLRLGTTTPLGYHYFWYVLCDVVCRQAPDWIGTRGAIMAGTTWTALALWASLSLWLRTIRPEREWTKVRWMLAALLLAISGLDVIAVGMIILRQLKWHSSQWLPYPSLDWWNADQVTNWLDVVIWVPHCAASLVACAIGCLILLQNTDRDRKQRSISSLVAGACFASAAGMSIYVAFGFAVAIACYVVFLLIRKDWKHAMPFIVSGVLALLLAAPFLLELRANVASPDFLHIGPKIVPLLHRLPGSLGATMTRAMKYVLYPPGLAITLFCEFGFWLIAAFYWWRTGRSDDNPRRRWLLVLMFAAPLLLTMVVRSSLTNDLGMRAIFCGQFALAVMAGEWLMRRCPEPRFPSVVAQIKQLPRFALILLALGLLTTLSEAALLRTYTMFQELNVVDYTFIDWPNLGLSVASTRNAYEWLKKHSRPEAIEQLAPSDSALYFVGGYSDRQTVVTGPYQLDFRVKYKSSVEFALKNVGDIFRNTALSASEVGCICSRWNINYLVITSHDPVWKATTSWIWHTSPVYQDAMTRVYTCSRKHIE